MRLIWATDIHLNFISRDAALSFCHSILELDSDGLLLTGDIAEGSDIVAWLEFLKDNLEIPIYFVLGNHDYYHSSIVGVRQQIRKLDTSNRQLNWLGDGKVVGLSSSTALLGHGGWGDARAGDFMSTPIRLNDHRLIRELSNLPRATLMNELHRLGDEAAAVLSRSLNEAMSWADHIVVMTHVPPFVGACWYQGQAGADERWIPDFVCMATGSALMDAAKANPHIVFDVYCGHTHGEGFYSPIKNLSVHTGKAEYKNPQVQRVIEL